MFEAANRATARERGWLAIALAVLGCGAAMAQESRVPPALRELSVVRIEASLGVAILRAASGEHRTLRRGDLLDGGYRITRLYADRIEVRSEVTQGAAAPQSFWIAMPNGAGANVQPVTTRPTDTPPLYNSTVMPSAGLAGRTQSR